jgi:hypothetical protein
VLRIDATLPTLGAVAVDFHKESQVVADFMGEKEWRRLRSVPHLGVAASVFTGVNHSRLEYVLLQSAVAGLVAKLHKNDEQFALSNEVMLTGISTPISSGEELLKIWALLSNYGHAQFTYGVERALLQQASGDPSVRDWLTTAIRHRDLRKWAIDVVEKYAYVDFRYLLALLRISLLPSHDRRKNRFAHYLRNLLLPLASLFPDNAAARHKLARLRDLYARIRLLSMVALDAHYSHNPISIDLNSAIIGMAELLPRVGRDSGFDQLLRDAAGWLADELYLHPNAVAAQREYELRFDARFPRRFARAVKSQSLPTLIFELMNQGLGPPKPKVLCHLIRLSLPGPRRQLLVMHNVLEAQRQLQKELLSPPRTYLSIDTNTFTRTVHLDFLYRTNVGTLRDVTKIFTSIQKWLVRTVEADSLARARRLYSSSFRTKEQVQVFKSRDVVRQINRYTGILRSVFEATIRYLLPENRRGVVAEAIPINGTSTPVMIRMRLSDGGLVDTVSPRISEILEENPDNLAQDRLQELRCLREAVNQSEAPFVLACAEKLTVRDEHGRPVDDWDGVMIEISDRVLALTIIEAKTGGTPHNRESTAFDQLDSTRKLLTARHRLRYRRRRISGMGAQITFTSTI